MTRLSPRTAFALLIAASLLACSRPDVKGGHGPRVLALEYGHSNGFRRFALIRSASPDARQAVSWMAWVIAAEGRVALVDTGFDDRRLAEEWKLDRFVTVPRILERIGIRTDDVTDVILTHTHWDHIGNVTPFGRARFWLQRVDLAWARGQVSAERPEKAGVRLADLEKIDAMEKELRLTLLDGSKEVLPGVSVHVGGRHTGGIQWISVRPAGTKGAVVLASDIAYLFENVETRTPPGSSLDPERDLAAISDMLRAARPGCIIPGHDPEVMRRFPKVAEGVVDVSAGCF